MAVCSVDGCKKPVHVGIRGLCKWHYELWRRRADPSLMRTRRGIENKTTKHAIRRPTMRNLAWAAGFLEGEGSFHQAARGRSTIASAAQVNGEPVQQLMALFGGSAKQYPLRDGLIWKWSAHGARARGIAMTLFPLMSARRQEQIRHALA